MTNTEQIFVKFSSHWARDYGLNAIGLPKPKGYYSFQRNSYPGGIYLLNQDQFNKLKNSNSSH